MNRLDHLDAKSGERELKADEETIEGPDYQRIPETVPCYVGIGQDPTPLAVNKKSRSSPSPLLLVAERVIDSGGDLDREAPGCFNDVIGLPRIP